MTEDPASIRRLYGRSKGHKLRVGQQAMLDTMLPELAIPPIELGICEKPGATPKNCAST